MTRLLFFAYFYFIFLVLFYHFSFFSLSFFLFFSPSETPKKHQKYSCWIYYLPAQQIYIIPFNWLWDPFELRHLIPIFDSQFQLFIPNHLLAISFDRVLFYVLDASKFTPDIHQGSTSIFTSKYHEQRMVPERSKEIKPETLSESITTDIIFPTTRKRGRSRRILRLLNQRLTFLPKLNTRKKEMVTARSRSIQMAIAMEKLIQELP